jgi:protein SCO1/2
VSAHPLPAQRDAPIGGQAVLEGVMMRGVSAWAVAIRREDGGIALESHPLQAWSRRRRILRLPVVRGVVALVESLRIGFKALGIAAAAQTGEDEELSSGMWAGAVVVALAALASNNLRAAPIGRWAANEFPNVPVTTQDGTTLHFYDDLIKGKAVAIDFIYTTCKDECPLETARLVQTQKLLGDRVGKDLFFYSITVDPRIDTPDVLKDYAEKFHVGPGWLFLTGDENDLRQIARKLGVSYSRDLLSSDGHGTTLMLGDEPTGQWMQESAEDNPRFLAATMGTFFGWRADAPAPSYAQAQPLALDQGGYVFSTRCVGCHTIGHGDLVGPDLAGVTDRRDRAWLTRYLREPDQALAEGDPVATALYSKYHQIPMPNLSLDGEDVDAVLAYLEAQSRAAPSPNTGTLAPEDAN